MKQWTDESGRVWEISLTIGKLKRIKDVLDIDLLDNPLNPLMEDIVKLIDIIYTVIEGQHDITAEEFGTELTTEGLDTLMKAFWAEYTDFFLVARPAWGVALLAGLVESGVTNLERLFEVIKTLGENVSDWEGHLERIPETIRSGSSYGSPKELSQPSLMEELQKVKTGPGYH